MAVAVMGVVNVSPESFHPGSVYVSGERLMRAAVSMVEAGASIIDVGARSTAPYLRTAINEDLETERLLWAVEILAPKLTVPVSADTRRPGPARAALDAGARAINDVSGLADPSIARLVAEYDAGVILMANPSTRRRQSGATPIATVRALLQGCLERARAAGIPDERVVLDPGIGYFRGERLAWPVWDLQVLADLEALADLGRPLCVGVSRKSFIGEITGRAATEDRLPGSLAAATVAVLNGAALIRAHDVAETVDAVRVAERLRRAIRG